MSTKEQDNKSNSSPSRSPERVSPIQEENEQESDGEEPKLNNMCNESSDEEMSADEQDYKSDSSLSQSPEKPSPVLEKSDQESDVEVFISGNNVCNESDKENQSDEEMSTKEQDYKSVPSQSPEEASPSPEESDQESDDEELKLISKKSKKIESDDENESDVEIPIDEQGYKSDSSPIKSPEKFSSVTRGSDDEPSNKKSKLSIERCSPVSEESDEEMDDEETELKEDHSAEEDSSSDGDDESDKSDVDGLITSIFGESDDEGEFEGFQTEDVSSNNVTPASIASAAFKQRRQQKRKHDKIISDSEDDDEDEQKDDQLLKDIMAPLLEQGGSDDDVGKENKSKGKKKAELDESDDDEDIKSRENIVSDFDLMMQKKKNERSRKRKSKDEDIINDSDDKIAAIIGQMRVAAQEDRKLNEQKKIATKKLKLLPMVMSQMKKQNLHSTFLDLDVLNVMAEWLAPLPDKRLPHLNIRQSMLKQLIDFPNCNQYILKKSGIGKAIMYLSRHPKETKENREMASILIRRWASPIFNVTTDYHSLSKEEREQRDQDHIPKRRRKSSDEEEEQQPKKYLENDLVESQRVLRPGDKGWVARARVPMPSDKDYVNRPKWNVETEFGRNPSKKPLTRIEKHLRSVQEKKRRNKSERAITISIEGRKMAI